MDGILVGSTLGLLGGVFITMVGRTIIDAVQTGTYETVIGLQFITGIVATTGVVICVISIIGIIVGVWRTVR